MIRFETHRGDVGVSGDPATTSGAAIDEHEVDIAAGRAATLPQPRGPLSAALVDVLTTRPRPVALPRPGPAPVGSALLHDEDRQLALYICYELHYHGWSGVDDEWEWSPSLLAFRSLLEADLTAALQAVVGPLDRLDGLPVADALSSLVDEDTGPSVARYVQRQATLEQFREFVTHRSIYHLKEADPHTWAIPRVGGRTKAALVEIQMDEYGGGNAAAMHAELFRVTMAQLGLDTRYGVYVDVVPAITLATSNVMSLFGLHRSRRGALLGHLAAFEMTSSLPNRRYGNGLRRLGGNPVATEFYDVHVQADAVHEQIAAHDMCGSMVEQEPAARADVLFGAASALAVDAEAGAQLLEAWRAGRSSLRGGSHRSIRPAA